MSYLVVIVLLVLFVCVEFLLIKKGMKAGRKTSQYLQSSTKTGTLTSQNRSVAPPSSSPNKSILQKEKKANTHKVDEPEVLSERRKNIIAFPEKPSTKKELSDTEPQKASTPSSAPMSQEERSMEDIIKEIRGSSSSSPREPQFSRLRSTSPTLEPKDIRNIETDGISEDEENGEYEEYIEEIIEEEEPLEDIEDVELIEEEELIEDVSEDQDAIDEEESSQRELSPEETIKIGLDLVRQGQLDEGITYIERAIQYVPEKADAHFNLGIAYTLKEDMPRAIQAYQRAIEIDTQYGKAFYNLGTLYLKQGNIQDAILKLERAAKLLPDPMKALWNLYEAYRSDGLYTKALANLQRLIQLEPDDASLYNHLGICYVKLGDYAKAIDAWKKSIALGASSQLIHYNLGKTYELYGEFSNARKHYDMFIQMASNSDEWQELVTEVQERLMNLEV